LLHGPIKYITWPVVWPLSETNLTRPSSRHLLVRQTDVICHARCLWYGMTIGQLICHVAYRDWHDVELPFPSGLPLWAPTIQRPFTDWDIVILMIYRLIWQKESFLAATQ